MTTAIFVLLAVLLCLYASAACLQLGRLDNRLGDDMDPRPTLSSRVRRWLGLEHIDRHLRQIEDTMATVITLLNNLAAQQEAVSAAQATSFHNIDAAFQQLKDAIANGDASPEIQAAADNLSAGFATLQKAAEDEGRVYEPTDNSSDQPADGGNTPPVDNGEDVPPADNGDTGDVPPVVNARR